MLGTAASLTPIVLPPLYVCNLYKKKEKKKKKKNYAQKEVNLIYRLIKEMSGEGLHHMLYEVLLSLSLFIDLTFNFIVPY
jgi:hypothetical protein